ncbi:DUF2637 domain-containing protein [Streptomyces sp. ME01-18h]|uniref:DUF2637 domain-containing protein n=1 Tax=Streptomyces sp. ME01-18h TaxID=462920 RepID=UPI0029A553FC|nr:DUF2637 domain-containing protein [Streptomyces sp. ME01-18h]MDX3402967.1 DUF2637 domain-containing protein [Streptomyces sp. ME01-18h]
MSRRRDRPPLDDQPGQEQPAKTKLTAEQYVLRTAGIVIVALTAGAFWLSYAHLAEVAAQHGLRDSSTRRWAWPATLDAFIVAGELLMLRAGLRRVTDKWAIGVTAIGSFGSIGLNVAGVTGAREVGSVPLLDYVVAAVPPAAAMVAFGVLMRQIHELVAQPAVDHPTPGYAQMPEPPATTFVQPTELLTTTVGQSGEAPAEGVQPADLLVQPGPAAEPSAAVSVQSPESPADDAAGRVRGGRPPGAPFQVLVEIGRAAAAEQGKLTRAVVRTAVEDKGLTVGSKRLTEVMAILRAELEPSAEPDLPGG